MIMAAERVDDLKAFRDFVDGQLSNGGANLTPEDCLELWIVENLSTDERQARFADIRQGLDDLDAGRTRSARESLAELRLKHNLPEVS
jgi:hypothetical protein